MQVKFIDTKYRSCMLSEKDIERYRKAKRFYDHILHDGYAHREAIVRVADHMNINMKEAGHLVRTNIKNLDSFNTEKAKPKVKEEVVKNLKKENTYLRNSLKKDQIEIKRLKDCLNSILTLCKR